MILTPRFGVTRQAAGFLPGWPQFSVLVLGDECRVAILVRSSAFNALEAPIFLLGELSFVETNDLPHHFCQVKIFLHSFLLVLETFELPFELHSGPPLDAAVNFAADPATLYVQLDRLAKRHPFVLDFFVIAVHLGQLFLLLEVVHHP